jgi:Zn-dependent M28 family amino/carboxypeptidase
MKLAVILVVLVGAGRAQADTKSCVDDGKAYDEQALSARLALLASDELGGRVPGSDGDKQARAHIVERMTCLGLAPVEQPFTDGEKRETANVIGTIAGADKEVGSEIIVIGAHHDHLGDGHLGANDNASGVTALLAIAQAIKQKGSSPRRTIAFVAFGAEEQGMVGSTFFVKHAPATLPIDKIVQYINLDMVGSYKSKKFVTAMGAFAKHTSRKLLDKLDDTYKIKVAAGGRARGSDHVPFCQAKVPYVFFWTPDAKCYHRTCDKAEAIDLAHMAQIAALAGDLAWEMAKSTTDLAAAKTKLGCGQKY